MTNGPFHANKKGEEFFYGKRTSRHEFSHRQPYGIDQEDGSCFELIEKIRGDLNTALQHQDDLEEVLKKNNLIDVGSTPIILLKEVKESPKPQPNIRIVQPVPVDDILKSDYTRKKERRRQLRALRERDINKLVR